MSNDIDAIILSYKDRLEILRTWKKGVQRKPHKFLLLLTIIRLLETKPDHLNQFTFEELEDLFGEVWEESGIGKRSDAFLEYPFYHMTSDGFWHLKIKPGAESIFELYRDSKQPKLRFTKSRIKETIEYAYLQDDFYFVISDNYGRDAIKKIIDSQIIEHDNKVTEAHETTSLFQHEATAIRSILAATQKFSLGKVISNLIIFDPATNDYYECDVILVGYSGIYLTELKHWSGHIQVASYNWIKDGVKYRRDPHATNTFKARIIKGIYQHQFRTYPPDLRVESVVVLTNPGAEVVGAASPKTVSHCPTFDSIDNFIDYLRQQKASNPNLLSLDQIDRITAHLESLQQPKRASRYSVPGYEIVEHLTQKTDLIEVVARPTIGQYRKLSRFRVFLPPVKADPIEKERFVKRARNTLDALAQIGEHANVLRVWPVPDESGALIEGSDWSEEGTLRDSIMNRGGPFEQDVALDICAGILRALEVAHGKGVIHRAVKPENVLIVGDQPRLMNFDLSFQVAAESNLTVIPDASTVKRDAYTAPEVYLKGDVDEATDLFSLGVILYELLVGERPFKSSMDLNKFGGRLSEDSMSKLRAKEVPNYVVDTIEGLVRFERSKRLQSTKEVLSLLQATKDISKLSEDKTLVNQLLGPGDSYDVYRIEKLIGEGAEAQVYEARTLRNEPVALKIFNRDVPLPRILDEEHAASAVRSSYLAQAKRSGHWNNDRYFIEMSFIDGRTMRDEINSGARPPKEVFMRATSCLLEAVHALHCREEEGVSNPLVHGDIKPDNIILKPDGGAVLFDFGCAGLPRVDKYQGTEGYVAPDLISGSDLQFCESGDLFALGVTLFEWLFGKRPYDEPIVGEVPKIPRELTEEFPENLVNWLLRSVQTETGQRFSSAKEMQAAFLMSIEGDFEEEPELPSDLEPEDEAILLEPRIEIAQEKQPGNPFVAYLNSLHNASASNENALAESQALNQYFGFIHVPLKVTDHIYRQLADKQGSHVILTGHAGDGKSTIGLELFKRAKGLDPLEPLSEKMQSKEQIRVDDRDVTLIKDMSELKESERLDLLQSACTKDHQRYFIISNTGTLLNAFKALAQKSEWFELQDKLLTALEAGTPTDFAYKEGHFQLINLVRTDNLSTACKIFERMLAPERWEPCETEGCRQECPVYFNVKMLREHWETAIHRIALAYRRLYEYGSRLTLRQITGHLAYAITAGLNYQDISAFANKAKSPPLRHFLFFNRFFGDCGELPDPAADQLAAVRHLCALEPGRRTHQRLERMLWMTEENVGLPKVAKSIESVYGYLRKVGAGRAHADALPRESARMQVRRLLYFYGDFDKKEDEKSYISTFLQSPMVNDFANWQKSGGTLSLLERRRLKQGILHVLQEHFTGIRLPENAGDQETIFITLNRHNFEIRQSAQIVLAKFQTDNFDLILQRFDSGIGETRFEPKLIENTTGKIMPLDLPFLDYVTNRFHGEIAQRLQSFYADRLEHFKVALLASKGEDQGHNMMLIRLQLNHRFKSQTVSIQDKVLEVI